MYRLPAVPHSCPAAQARRAALILLFQAVFCSLRVKVFPERQTAALLPNFPDPLKSNRPVLKYLPPLSGPSSVPNQGGYFRSFRLSLLHVRDSLCQNGLNMIIAQRIVYCFSVFSTLDQPRLLQKTKLMRYRGLAHVQQRRNITDTQLRGNERRQYPQAGLVGKRFEKI